MQLIPQTALVGLVTFGTTVQESPSSPTAYAEL
jgi:hypothetical protein